MDNQDQEPRKVWVTLFDDIEDDLYDGDFTYDDAERPRILLEFCDAEAYRAGVKTSHRVTSSSAKTNEKKTVTTTVKSPVKTTVTRSEPVKTVVKTTTTITRYQDSSSNRVAYKPIAQFEIGAEPENSSGCNVENLKNELRSENQSTIQDLYTEQERRFEVDDDRVGAINFIERAHQELQGEHEEDLNVGRVLKQLSQDIDSTIAKNKADITAQIAKLKDHQKNVEKSTNDAKTTIAARTKENKGLQDKIDIPEDLKEQGFSKEAKTLRTENAGLKKKVATTTADLLKESHERDNLLESHSKEVGGYNGTILKFYNLLSKAEQARKIHQDSLNEVEQKVSRLNENNDHLQQRIQIGDIDIDSLKSTSETLKRDHSNSNKVYGEHITELSSILVDQDREIGALRDQFNNIESQIKHLTTETDKQKVAISAYEKEMDDIKALGYDEKVATLQANLRKADEIRQKHQDELERGHENWSTKLNTFLGQEKERKRERDEMTQKVVENLGKLEAIQVTINQLLKSLDDLSNKKVSDDNKDKVRAALEEEMKNVSIKLKWAIGERDLSMKDLDDAIRLAREKDDEVKDQERRIRELLAEINTLKNLLEEKKRIIAQLERDIQLAIEEIERLKKIIEDLDRRIELLTEQIRQRDNEIAQLERDLYARDARIRQLVEMLGKKEPVEVSYKYVKGDLVDEMLAKYLIDCPVPVKRLGGGFYLFGTKKIYAKIMNEKLVVRVGGGYMFISEFITSYSEPEIIKLTKLCEIYGVDSIWDLDLEEIYYSRSPGARNSPKGGDASPGSFNKSKKGAALGSSMNGSKRQAKGIAPSQIVRKV